MAGRCFLGLVLLLVCGFWGAWLSHITNAQVGKAKTNNKYTLQISSGLDPEYVYIFSIKLFGHLFANPQSERVMCHVKLCTCI